MRDVCVGLGVCRGEVGHRAAGVSLVPFRCWGGVWAGNEQAQSLGDGNVHSDVGAWLEQAQVFPFRCWCVGLRRALPFTCPLAGNHVPVILDSASEIYVRKKPCTNVLPSPPTVSAMAFSFCVDVVRIVTAIACCPAFHARLTAIISPVAGTRVHTPPSHT